MPERLERPENIVRLAERLASLGYWVVPIPAGSKGPTVAGWDKMRLKPEDCAAHFAPGNLVGILHINNVVLDVDIYDADLAAHICAEARRRFPGALERIGQAPKSAFFLRMDEPGFKVRNTETHSRTADDGAPITASVEVRSMTRQAVAYGKHPDTGQPYRWVNGPELWETPWADLPLAEQAAVQSFRDWADEQIKRWAGLNDPKVIDLGLFPRAVQDERPSERMFIDVLRYVPASLGHEAGWCQTLMGIHHFYGGSARGLDVAKEWSSSDPRYSPQEVETKWRSFEPGKGVSFKSVLHHAKMNGADLRALSEQDRPQPRIRIATGVDQSAETQTEAETDFDAPPKPGRPKPKLEWFDDIKPSLKNAYLVKGFLGSTAMSVVYGPSNSGKTFFVLDLMFHIAIGAEWRGRRVRQAAVLYLAAEGGTGAADRFAALRLHHGICDVPMALRRAGLDLLNPDADLQNIYDHAQEIKAVRPDLPLAIVVDTLSRAIAGGDENSAADMTSFIRNVDAVREATGAHILIVHHSGKDTARGARGHSSLRAATDTEIELANDDGTRAAMVTKQRDYIGGETFAFDLKVVELGFDDDGEVVTSCVVEAADSDDFKAAQRAKGRGKNQQIIMETFDQIVAEGHGQGNPGGVGMPEPGQFWAVSIAELRTLAQGKMGSEHAPKLWRTAFEALTGPGGLFVTGNNLAWRVDRRKK